MRAPDDFSERWHKIEKLLSNPHLGIDANTVMVDAPLLLDRFRDPRPKQRSLREVLEELNRSNPRSKFPTSLQSAKDLRKFLAEIEGVLDSFDGRPSAVNALYFFNFEEWTTAKKALTVLADKLRQHIARLEAHGSRSQHNAAKAPRNAFWCELAILWQAATVNAKNKPLRRHRYKFISIVAPPPFAPRSEREVNAVLERRTKRADF
jgi:hypothetical protein